MEVTRTETSESGARATGIDHFKKTWAIVFVLLTAVFLVSVFYSAPPGDYFTICTFKNFTGLPCPGCGLTHSFCAFAKGRLAEALSYNAIGPPLFVVLVLVWVRHGFALIGRTRMAQVMDAAWKRLHLTAGFAIAFTIYGIGRMAYILMYSPSTVHHSPLYRVLLSLR